jgi:hypothetical protein
MNNINPTGDSLPVNIGITYRSEDFVHWRGECIHCGAADEAHHAANCAYIVYMRSLPSGDEPGLSGAHRPPHRGW